MNTGYPNSSQTLFDQLFANRISQAQTPGMQHGHCSESALVGWWLADGVTRCVQAPAQNSTNAATQQEHLFAVGPNTRMQVRTCESPREALRAQEIGGRV